MKVLKDIVNFVTDKVSFAKELYNDDYEALNKRFIKMADKNKWNSEEMSEFLWPNGRLDNVIPNDESYSLGSNTRKWLSREDLIARALQTEEGKLALGQAMAEPIRRNLDYQGIARRALQIDPMPWDAIPAYYGDWRANETRNIKVPLIPMLESTALEDFHNPEANFFGINSDEC